MPNVVKEGVLDLELEYDHKGDTVSNFGYVCTIVQSRDITQ